MIKLLLKSLFITVPRFFVITTLVTSLLYLDTSPLPEDITLTTLSYLIHISATFLFAKWAFHRSHPSWGDAGMVAGVFIVFGTMLEAWLSSVITRNTFWNAFTNYNWQSLLIVVLYIASVFAAAWHSQRVARKISTPSGMV